MAPPRLPPPDTVSTWTRPLDLAPNDASGPLCDRECSVAQDSQAAADAARIGQLPSLAGFARRFSAAIWSLNGTSIRRDLNPTDYASIRRVLDT